MVVIVSTAIVFACAFALYIAWLLYTPITGLPIPDGFKEVVILTASFTAVLVAIPILSLLQAFFRILVAREEFATKVQLITARKNNIFANLLESSISMQQSDKLVDLIDDVLVRLEGLLPDYSLGIIVDSTRPSMVVSFTSREIPDQEKQMLLDENGNLFGDPIDDWPAEKRFHQFGDWYIFPMRGRKGRVIGKLMVKGKSLEKDNEEIIEIFLEQLTATAENKLLSIELEKMANTDQLTGLYSRNYFQMELERQFEIKEENSIIDFSIILIDVNGLKSVNDNFGHVAGDTLIIKSAELIKRSCRKEDWVCRVGGDEFVIICPSTRAEGVQIVVDRISEATKGLEIDVLDQNEQSLRIPLRVSQGLACSSEVEAKKVYALADERMYVNKRRFYREKDEKEKNEKKSIVK